MPRGQRVQKAFGYTLPNTQISALVTASFIDEGYYELVNDTVQVHFHGMGVQNAEHKRDKDVHALVTEMRRYTQAWHCASNAFNSQNYIRDKHVMDLNDKIEAMEADVKAGGIPSLELAEPPQGGVDAPKTLQQLKRERDLENIGLRFSHSQEDQTRFDVDAVHKIIDCLSYHFNSANVWYHDNEAAVVVQNSHKPLFKGDSDEEEAVFAELATRMPPPDEPIKPIIRERVKPHDYEDIDALSPPQVAPSEPESEPQVEITFGPNHGRRHLAHPCVIS